MKHFIEKTKIDKKLCIHCKHCNVYSGLGAVNRIMCNLYTSEVDGKELYSASENRSNIFRCGGNKWQKKENIHVCETANEAETLNSEEWTESFIPLARSLVNNSKSPATTCGGLDAAIKRVQEELAKT